MSGGEILGYRLYSGSSYCTVNANSPLEGWRYVNTFNPWHSGDTAGFAPEASGTRFAIGAVMEADADGDGYGDETQDLCPTSASTQASCPPVAATHAATDVAQTSAVLHGTLQPNGAATTYRFDYGEGAYTWQTPDVVVPASTEQRHVSATVSGLKPDTTYHFRLSASNDEGAVQGGDLTLTTARTPDTAPPETLITDGPLPLARDTNARLHFTSEAGTSFECKLDSGDWNPCSSPTSYTSLPDGEHLFLVHATDQAGNTDPTPAMRAWTVETAAPSPTTDAPSATTDAPPTAGDTSPSTGGGTGQDALSWPPSPAEVRAPTQRRVLALLRDASLTAPPRGAVKPADIGNGAPGINLSTGRVSAGTLTAVEKLQVGITYIANLPEAGTHAGATRNLILGTRTLQLNTGQIRALTVKLTGSTRKRLRKFDNLRVKRVLRLTDESGVTRTTIRITKLSVVGRP